MEHRGKSAKRKGHTIWCIVRPWAVVLCLENLFEILEGCSLALALYATMLLVLERQRRQTEHLVSEKHRGHGLALIVTVACCVQRPGLNTRKRGGVCAGLGKRVSLGRWGEYRRQRGRLVAAIVLLHFVIMVVVRWWCWPWLGLVAVALSCLFNMWFFCDIDMFLNFFLRFEFGSGSGASCGGSLGLACCLWACRRRRRRRRLSLWHPVVVVVSFLALKNEIYLSSGEIQNDPEITF